MPLPFFNIGIYIQRKTKNPIFNPLLISILGIIIFLSITKIPYENYKLGDEFYDKKDYRNAITHYENVINAYVCKYPELINTKRTFNKELLRSKLWEEDIRQNLMSLYA